MAAIIEPSFASNAMRAHTSPVSMADSLPNINFGFEDLRSRMATFTHKFNEFLAEGRKRVLEERNQFLATMAELQDEQKLKHKSIETVSQKLSEHAKTVAKESAENNEMHSAIAAVTTERDKYAAKCDDWRGKISATEKMVQSRRDAQRQHETHLDEQARFNGPELDFWMDYLCMRIDSAGREDRIRFTFSHIDDRDWEREAWLEICTEKKEYELIGHHPELERERTDDYVEKLNSTRDVGHFLKSMRELFVEAMK